MFPQLNAVFRSKSSNEIPNLQTTTDRNVWNENNPLINAGALTVRGDSYVISKPTDKANCLAKYFADINNKESTSLSPVLEIIINLKFNEFKRYFEAEQAEGKTDVSFCDDNRADDSAYGDDKGFFCNLASLKFILKKLNNKKSTGVDKIPNIALKNLPDPIVGLSCLTIC